MASDASGTAHEFRCVQCGWTDTRPDKCTRCGSLREQSGTAQPFNKNVVVDSPDHTAAPGMWSYACRCVRCRWEQWWNEGDNSVIPMPDEPHPDGEYADYFADRDEWSGWTHPNG